MSRATVAGTNEQTMDLIISDGHATDALRLKSTAII